MWKWCVLCGVVMLNKYTITVWVTCPRWLFVLSGSVLLKSGKVYNVVSICVKLLLA